MNNVIDLQYIEKIMKKIFESEARIGVCVMNHETDIVWGYKETEKFDTACSIMVFIMLEYFKQERMGKICSEELLEYTEENYATGSGTIKFLQYGSKIQARDLVELMIAASDHIAANMLIDRLGLETINQTIQEYEFYETKLFHKFLIPKIKNVGESTPCELALFYKKLNQNILIDELACRKMKKILKKQRYKDILGEKICLSMPKQYLDMACKSGKADGRIYDAFTDSYIVDAGIVYTTCGEYEISIMAELSYGSTQNLNDVKTDIQEISKYIYYGIGAR